MNNGDMPAMPHNRIMPSDVGINDVSEFAKYSAGLTKREYFAGLAMQGLLSDYRYFESCKDAVPSEHFASQAVAVADALLAELEK